MAAKTPEALNIQYLGSGDIHKRIEVGDDTILIPIGSCERHGNPFTPLGLDGVVTFGLVEHAAQKANVLHTPLMPFGYAPHHMGRPGEGWGTVSLRVETYRSLLEDIGRSLIYQGFNKLIMVSFHSFNVAAGEEVLFSLRFKTGAFVAFYGGRESEAARGILESLPDRLASDAEAALALALMGDCFQHEGYLAHGYRVHAPSWLGPAFTKRPGTGMAVSFQGAENIFLGMDDFEFVSPVAHDQVPELRATAEKGRKLLDVLSGELAAFVAEVKKLEIEVKERDFSERVR